MTFWKCLAAGMLAATAAVAGYNCASGPPAPPDSPSTAAALAPVPGAAVANSASVHKDLLFMDYRMDGVRTVAGVDLDPQLEAGPETDPELRLPARRMLPVSEPDGFGAREVARELEILEPAYWTALLYRTLHSMTPESADRGATVDILQRHVLFLYRENGAPRSVPIEFKPVEIRIRDCYSFNDLLERAKPFLQELLQRTGDAGRDVLLETGDTSEHGFPFIYARGRDGLMIYLRQPVPDERFALASQAASASGTLMHAVTSHTRAVISRPVASLARLFTLGMTTATDLGRPTPVSVFGDSPVPPVTGEAGMDLPSWEAQLDSITGEPTSMGRLRYLVDGKVFFPLFIDEILRARESLWLRLYIYDNDDYATWFAELLKRRAADIDVRILLDEMGTIGAATTHSESMPAAFSPPPAVAEHLRAESGIDVRLLANPWLSGDHSKTIVLDQRLAYIGGMNIGREYRYDWHDMMVQVEGPVVGSLVADYVRAWNQTGMLSDLRSIFIAKPQLQIPVSDTDYPVRVLYTRPGDSQILRAQIAAMRNARQRIYLENAYLTSDAVLFELAKARRRGVDVRVIIPYTSDFGIISRSNALAANTMLDHGIRVYVYPGMSHLKAAVFDGWACFGSANFDNLSFRINKELNLSTSHPPAVDALIEQVFTPDMERAIELTEPLPADWTHYLSELLADSL